MLINCEYSVACTPTDPIRAKSPSQSKAHFRNATGEDGLQCLIRRQFTTFNDSRELPSINANVAD
jgi:hypothetical protein